MRQQDGIAFAVGFVQSASERVGHGVHGAQAGVGEGQTGVEAREGHLASQHKVIRRREGVGEVRPDQFNGLGGVHVRQR